MVPVCLLACLPACLQCPARQAALMAAARLWRACCPAACRACLWQTPWQLPQQPLPVAAPAGASSRSSRRSGCSWRGRGGWRLSRQPQNCGSSWTIYQRFCSAIAASSSQNAVAAATAAAAAPLPHQHCWAACCRRRLPSPSWRHMTLLMPPMWRAWLRGYAPVLQRRQTSGSSGRRSAQF